MKAFNPLISALLAFVSIATAAPLDPAFTAVAEESHLTARGIPKVHFMRYKDTVCTDVRQIGTTDELKSLNACKNFKSHGTMGYWWLVAQSDQAIGCKVTVYDGNFCEGESKERSLLGEANMCFPSPFEAGVQSVRVTC